MNISHNFQFRWNNHISHLSQTFSELRYEEVYCDTTLVTEEGFILKVHGAVLIATSRYFEKALSNVTPDQHPIVVLKGIKFAELSCLLDYIYQGVTQIDQHLMECVLEAADLLEIKGLAKMKNNLSIKKLIAPSPSAVLSRNSPVHSTTSKSPTPSPSTQSPSHSPPSDVYSQSVALKPDTEEPIDEMGYVSSRSRHTFSDKSVGGEGIVVAATTSKHTGFSTSSEYLEQSLGIDLSLSRVSCEENGKLSGKSFNHLESPVRKRKALKLMDDTSSANESEFSKCEEEKSEDLVLHKKKRSISRPVCHIRSVSSCVQEEALKANPHLAIDKLASLISKDKCGSPSVQKHKTIIDSDHMALDSHVEVLCSDGALTISVTADSSPKNSFRNTNSAQLSLSMKKTKRKKWSKREMLSIKRENLEEKKSNEMMMKRPRRLKSYAIQTDSYCSEPLSVHCDPPFPTEDVMKQSPAKGKPTSNSENDKSERDRENMSTEDEIGLSVALQQSEKVSEERKVKKLSCISPLTLFTLPPTKEKEKQTRTTLTLEEKIKVIQAFLDGKSQRQIANLHGIGKTQVNGIVKKRDEILSLYRESVVRGEKLTMKRHRKSEYASLNDHLIKWYRHMTVVAGMKITTGMLRAKALQIAPQLGYHDFKASNGWLATFKTNNNLKFSRMKKLSDSFSSDNYDDLESQKEGELFEEEIEEGNNINNANNAQSSGGAPSTEGIASYSVGLHLGSMRGETDPENVPTCQLPPPPVSNIAIGNSLLSSSGPLPKPPQMSNMALGTNIAYNLTREHTRTDLTHLSDLHTATSVNAPPSLSHPPHPSLPKPPEAPLSYKTEDALTYGYETQGRMNETASRGTEYNYTHYGFPSTYYGYHFLGQY